MATGPTPLKTDRVMGWLKRRATSRQSKAASVGGLLLFFHRGRGHSGLVSLTAPFNDANPREHRRPPTVATQDHSFHGSLHTPAASCSAFGSFVMQVPASCSVDELDGRAATGSVLQKIVSSTAINQPWSTARAAASS